jgi:hypothetical protein
MTRTPRANRRSTVYTPVCASEWDEDREGNQAGNFKVNATLDS